MTPPKEHVHLLPDETDAPGDWIEERPVSELAPNAYQRRLAAVSEAEDRFYEEIATAAENETREN